MKPEIALATPSGVGAAEGRRAPVGRIAVVALVVATCLSFSGYLFWREDVRYSLPTPRPDGLVQPPAGSSLEVDAWLAAANLPPRAGRPVLLHFFNPECPCTRFNVDHVRKLHARFGERVEFIAVAQTSLSGHELDAAMAELKLGIPHFVDTNGRVAAAAGVYSTPQAVLVDAEQKLVYRGNYNVSRYCTDPETEFVRIAIESLESSREAPRETPAYGCELPTAHGAPSTRGGFLVDDNR
ncbi:MAG: redoxin domain-containing protein [Polyangiaceae bacterium]|nr:redoxin domain-containing protein [Polyangiaceae bacterium]